jgi:hypothetical protein
MIVSNRAVRIRRTEMEQSPSTLKLEERHGEAVVVVIENFGFDRVSGAGDAACEQLRPFLAHIAYGERG